MKHCDAKRHEVLQTDSSYRLIPLTMGKNAIVDAADYEWLSQWNWCTQWNKRNNTYYAKRRENYQLIFMHRQILGCVVGEFGDHRNHDTLDNRRNNLRKCTTTQNNQNKRARTDNTSGFKGVYWHKAAKRWCAELMANREKVYLGLFDSKHDAANAYWEAAKIYHGEFAAK